ncbi:MAG: response regulator [Chloroflexota bacterium]
MREKIFIVDDNEVSRKLVGGVLKKEGYEVYAAASASEALAAIPKVMPDLVILDVMMPEMDGYQLCRRLRDRPETARLPILILTSLNQLEERLKAFEAGADDFIPKPFQPQEFLARVQVALRRSSFYLPAPAKTQAQTIAIFSLRGGIGVSSIATNTAIGLSQLWKMPVTLIDLALDNGISALMMDLPLRHSWAELSHIKAEEIDTEVIYQILLKHPSGLSVLAAPRRPYEAELLNGEQVKQVLSLLAKQNEYLVLDLPHNFSETTLSALDQADQILLVLSPELAAVQCTSIALDVFAKIGYSPEKVKLVLNWNFKGRGLPREEIEKVLQKRIEIVLPFAGDELINALTMGKPPVWEAPESALGGLFEDFAFYWSKSEHKKNPPKPYSEALVRVQKRMKTRQK